jgi:site-specific recombinase XerD
MSSQIAVTEPTGILQAVLKRRGAASIAAHEVAIRLPLADLVEATIVAACKSPHTARTYRRAIGEFITALGARFFPGRSLVERIEHGKYRVTVYDYHETPAGVLLLVDAATVDGFGREHPGLIHGVRTFLRVAYRDGVLTNDQATALGLTPYRAKVKQNKPVTGRRLSVMEVQFLRAAVDTSNVRGLRDLAILDVMLFAGLRRQEVAQLSLSDFRQDEGRWVIHLTGKGGKVRKVGVHRELFASLSAWLEVYGHGLGDPVPAFCSIRRGGHLQEHGVTSQSVSDMVARYGHKAGLSSLTGEGRLTPHDARRTFARRLLDCGATLPAIQRLLGHSSVETTILYVGLREDEAKDAVDLLNYG